MKWEKAIERIKLLDPETNYVLVDYHRKWDRYSRRLREVVYSTSEYEYGGETCTAVTTSDNILTEDAFIIDKVAMLFEVKEG